MRARPPLTALLAGTGVAILAVGVAIALPAASAPELLANPGFESGNLAGWQCDASDSVVTGQARSGSYSLGG
jgi:hypothetical protein